MGKYYLDMANNLPEIPARLDSLLQSISGNKYLSPEFITMAEPYIAHIRHHYMEGNTDALQIGVEKFVEFIGIHKNSTERAVTNMQNVRTIDAIKRSMHLENELFELKNILSAVENIEEQIHEESVTLLGFYKEEGGDVIKDIQKLEAYVSANFPEGKLKDRVSNSLIAASAELANHKFHAASKQLESVAWECNDDILHNKKIEDPLKEKLRLARNTALGIKDSLDAPVKSYAKKSGQEENQETDKTSSIKTTSRL